MAPRSFSQEDSQLIAELHSLYKKSPKLVKTAEYATPALPAVTVESWKMNEFKYYGFRLYFRPSHGEFFSMKEPDDESRYRIFFFFLASIIVRLGVHNPMWHLYNAFVPTYLPLLLIDKDLTFDTSPRYRVVARGYDKFSTSERSLGQQCVCSSIHGSKSHCSFDQWSSLEAYTKPPYPDAQVERMHYLRRGSIAD